MEFDLDQPAELKFTGDPVQAPADWTGTQHFATLRLALEAAVERTGDAPWIRVGGETIRPADVDELWKLVFRPLSD